MTNLKHKYHKAIDKTVAANDALPTNGAQVSEWFERLADLARAARELSAIVTIAHEYGAITEREAHGGYYTAAEARGNIDWALAFLAKLLVEEGGESYRVDGRAWSDLVCDGMATDAALYALLEGL